MGEGCRKKEAGKERQLRERDWKTKKGRGRREGERRRDRKKKRGLVDFSRGNLAGGDHL